MASIQLLEDYQNPKIRQFCPFTFPPSVKCTSSPAVQAAIPRINDMVNSQLALVVARAELYMDVGVDLFAKYE